MQDFELPNQMRVIVVHHSDAPVIQTSLVFKRDYTAEPHLLSQFVGSFTRSNANDPLQIAGETNWTFYPGSDGSPAQAYPMEAPPGQMEWGDNFIRWQMRVPAGNLEQALWILRDTTEGVTPYVDAKARFIDAQKKNLERNWGSSSWSVANANNQYLYPSTPWQHPTTWEDIKAIDGWSSSTVQQYLDSVVQPANATLLIVGNVDPEEAKKIAIAQFGGWQPHAAGAKPPVHKVEPPAIPTESSKILVFDQPSATQTGYRMSCRLNVTDPEKQRTAVTVLGNLLGQDTFRTMRVKEGLAYSPGATTVLDADGSGLLIFYSDTVNSGVGRMIEFSKSSIKRLESGDVSTDQMTLEKLRDARIEGMFFQSLDQVTGELTSVVANGRSWDALSNHGPEIASVTVDDLKELMKGCSDHVITTLQGPKDVLGPELDERGFKYEVVNYHAEGDDLLWKYDPKQAKKDEKQKQKDDKKKAKEDAKKKKDPDQKS